LWLDPGDKGAQDHSYNVIMDVLRRYDLDGVHFDDYFYPYPVVETPGTQQPSTGQNAVSNALNAQGAPPIVNRTPEREVDFPDEPSWKAYVASGGKLARADWRRDNVNRFVERVYKGVKAEKPWVRFGISPFGIGRPDRRPPGIAGFSQYDKLYADVELWLQRGWLDYLAPQLYWPIDQAPQAFGVLLDYWHAQNTLKRDIFPGLYTSRIEETPRGWMPKEIENQIALMRAKRDVALGHIHFSAAPLMQNRRDVNASLTATYSNPTLPFNAQLNWGNSENNVVFDIDTELNDRPDYLVVQIKSLNSVFSAKNGVSRGNGARLIALNMRYGSAWQFALLPVGESNGPLLVSTSVAKTTKDGTLNAIAASFVDRYGRESVRYVRDVSVAAP
ncbi:MAG: glycoside hydrolase family 10 protein, partial [Casimicrobium sp.]